MTLNRQDCVSRRVAWRLGLYNRLRELRSTGLSQVLIAEVLNDEGYTSITGARIDQPMVSTLLSGTKANQDMGGS